MGNKSLIYNNKIVMTAQLIKENLSEYGAGSDFDHYGPNTGHPVDPRNGAHEEYFDRYEQNMIKTKEGVWDLIIEFISDEHSSIEMSIFEVLEELVSEDSILERTTDELDEVMQSEGRNALNDEEFVSKVQDIVRAYIDYNNEGGGEWNWPMPEDDRY